MAVRAGADRVHDALGDPLAVEARELLEQVRRGRLIRPIV
jgi:hypothetical protein